MGEKIKKVSGKGGAKKGKTEEKKARWSSKKRLERDLKSEAKPDKPRWVIYSKKVKELKEDLRKKRRTKRANHKILLDKGVIKK